MPVCGKQAVGSSSVPPDCMCHCGRSPCRCSRSQPVRTQCVSQVGTSTRFLAPLLVVHARVLRCLHHHHHHPSPPPSAPHPHAAPKAARQYPPAVGDPPPSRSSTQGASAPFPCPAPTCTQACTSPPQPPARPPARTPAGAPAGADAHGTARLAPLLCVVITPRPCCLPAWPGGRFHVDDMSSAHVYLRLAEGCDIANIPAEALEDCTQLVKQNSIQGGGKGQKTAGGGGRGAGGRGEEGGLLSTWNQAGLQVQVQRRGQGMGHSRAECGLQHACMREAGCGAAVLLGKGNGATNPASVSVQGAGDAGGGFNGSRACRLGACASPAICIGAGVGAPWRRVTIQGPSSLPPEVACPVQHRIMWRAASCRPAAAADAAAGSAGAGSLGLHSVARACSVQRAIHVLAASSRTSVPCGFMPCPVLDLLPRCRAPQAAS